MIHFNRLLAVFASAMLLALVSCNAGSSPQSGDAIAPEPQEVAFEVAKNYFFKNGQEIPESPKITTEEEFNKLFGMATTMGPDGKPTAIDFAKQFVLAVVLPVTDMATDITPVKVEAKGDSLFYTYDVKIGEKQSYSIQPLSIIIIDKEYENKVVVLVNDKEMTYFPAIERYLVNEIGKQYAQGEHCVPFHKIVAVDEKNAEDILIWGDFWVFNYSQEGDTLKTVSGGNHPGLMHIRQTEKGYEVTGFDQVADGAGNVESAKKIFGDKYNWFQTIQSDEKKREVRRAEGLAKYVKSHNLPVTMYQDFGWPAKKLENPD